MGVSTFVFPPSNMDEGIGYMYAPMLIGTFLNCILYGATVLQVVIYFQTFKRDSWWMKMFVFYLLFCETLNTVFDVGVVYEPLIVRYGSPQVATQAPKMLSASPLMTVIISLPVQLFIAWRVKVVTKSNVLPIIITFFAVSAFAGGIATTVTVVLIHFEYALFPKNDGAVITWLAASAAADVIITLSLVHGLWRKRTGFAATDDIINRVIRLTVQTGFVTAVSATLDITLFLLFRPKGQMWNFIFDFALSKLYSNTILSSLNARCGWKATPTVRDNVLFGYGTNRESAARNQVEALTTVATDLHPESHPSTVSLKVLGSGDGYGLDSDSMLATKIVPTVGEEV